MPIDINPYKEDSSLTRLHWEFGKMIARRGAVPEDDAPAVELLGAKSLQAIEDGHSCLALDAWRNSGMAAEEERQSDTSPLTVPEWEGVLDRNPLLFAEEAGVCKPFYYDREHQLLYLQKYYLAETRIAEFVRNHLGVTPDVPLNDGLKAEIHGLSQLFAGKNFEDDRQQQAVAMALTHQFSILTGGPGTGKTTTLASILVMEQRKRPAMSIALAAPTGKAAIQMKESLANELLNNLDGQQITEDDRNRLNSLPASTLHRLLGMTGDGSAPRYDHTNPLPYDLIVVDEASMVSLKMMEQLFDALSPTCRLLLIGDQNQLASVEAGSVLGDFCSHCAVLNPQNLQEPSQGYVMRLLENHRLQKGNRPLKDFLEGMSGVNGDVSAENMKPQTDVLFQGANPLFKAKTLQLAGTKKQQRETVKAQLESTVDAMLRQIKLPDYFPYYFGEEETKNITFSLKDWKALKRVPGDNELAANASQLPLALSWLYLESFRIICAVHEGMFGEKTFNGFMAEILDKKMGDNGIPVIILRNDKETNLYNGDVGIFWNRRVYFPKWELNPAGHKIFNCRRSYEPHRLPEHTFAFAMTIHKSQGSGYDNVLMVLPEQDQRVISRELIYTGISRTKHCFELWGDRAIFEAAIDRPTCRWSGLPHLLA